MNIVLFLIAHFLGDFILQPNQLVELKASKIRYQILHALIYAVLFMVVLSFFLTIFYTLLISFLIFAFHFLIDWLRIKSDKENNSPGFKFISFILDQITHITIIVLVAIAVNFISMQPNAVYEYINQIFPGTDVLYLSLIILSYIIILSPTSVLIKHFFTYFFKSLEPSLEVNEESREASIGSLIGKLERILILSLGLMGLYSSIAIVLAAKSLARFRQLENREFAEKYLVGTLLSLIIAIICIGVISFIT